MYIKVETDLTRLSRPSVAIPSSWDFAASGHFLPGEWVYVNDSGEVARVTESVVTHENVHPLFTGSERDDVKFTLILSYLDGVFVAETDNHKNETLAVNDPLTIEGDAGTPERGRLRKAASGEIIIARVVQTPVAGVRGLRFRRLQNAGKV
jgi:hypothetical protein